MSQQFTINQSLSRMKRRNKIQTSNCQMPQVKIKFEDLSDCGLSFDLNEACAPWSSENSKGSASKSQSQSSEYEQNERKSRKSKSKKKGQKCKKQASQSSHKKNVKLQSTSSKKQNNEERKESTILKSYSPFYFEQESTQNQEKQKIETEKRKKKQSQYSIFINNESNTIKQEQPIEKNIKSEEVDNISQSLDKQTINSSSQQIHSSSLSQLKDYHITNYTIEEGQVKHKSFANKPKFQQQNLQKRILYTFEPKYKRQNQKNKNEQGDKIILTAQQVASSHELFVELVRFYQNRADFLDPVGLFR